MIEAAAFVSGGVTSWAEAKLCAQEYGGGRVTMVFADVIIESADTYASLISGAGDVLERSLPASLVRQALSLTPVHVDEAGRKADLAALRHEARYYLPELAWLADGRTPWDVFVQSRFIGNTRADNCSATLKREQNDAFMRAMWSPGEVRCHVGMTHDEEGRKQRFTRLAAGKLPYVFRSILVERRLTKESCLAWARTEGVLLAEAYALGRPHANCGGGCVKQGHALWLLLLDTDRDTYLWWERKEQEWQRLVGKPNTILRDRRGGRTVPLSLRALRARHERGLSTEEHMRLEEGNPCGDACVGL